MRIKRTYGATMRDALAQVKLEQGADAVILGNRKVPGGVEILSAIDFDQNQLDQYAGQPGIANTAPAARPKPVKQLQAGNGTSATVESLPDFILNQSPEGRREPTLGLAQSTAPTAQAQPAPTSPPAKTPPANRKRAAKANTDGARARMSREKQAQSKTAANSKQGQRRSGTLPVEEEALARQTQADQLLSSLRDNRYPPQPARSEADPMMQQVKDELKNMRDLMKSQLNVLEWERYSQRHPVRSVLLNLMTELGLGADVTELVFDHLGEINSDPHKVWQQALAVLARAIPIASSDVLTNGGRVALVGSTGVGKTTTIAKLAARFAHNHGKQSVALVTTDNFRIGAHEQLQHFARMLEIPLLTANSSEELTDRLKMLADKRLVLIDTAGMSQNDVRLSEQFHKLQHGSPEIRPYLVLSANTQMAALNETINNFSKVKLSGAIVTKLDESASLGGVITAAIRHQLPLTYCGTGQRVPEDLHQAKNHRLVSKAVSLMQRHSEQFDKESLAFRYNHIISQQQR